VQLAVMDKIDGTIKTGADYNTLEYKLLNFLQTRAGTICTYVDIANGLWGSRSRKITAKELGSSAGYNSPQITQIKSLICALRRKLEVDPNRPQHITTIRGVGYVWYNTSARLDDGIDYAARDREAENMRRQLSNAFYGLQLAPPPDWCPGPEHPAYIEVKPSEARSVKAR
jgi:DNA-binding winged helix-turn-helix (wHTH) protein